jgi:hypothetical protein
LLAAFWNQPQFGSHHIWGCILAATTTRRHHKHILIIDIDKQDHKVSSYSSGLVWMESWENCLNQATTSDPNQTSQAGFSSNNT